MPKLKQPSSLEKIAFDVLLEWVVQCCDQISAPKGFSQGYRGYRYRVPGKFIAEGSLDELHRGISVIKDEVCSRLPWHLVADFCIRFLDKFYNKLRPKTHHKAALEIIMDTEIGGLKLKGRILDHFNTENAHRFRSLKELELDYYFENYRHPPKNMKLENYHLDNLTTFTFSRYCTDHHLDIIARSCPKLKVLRIPYSIDVTDEGMRALGACSELSVIEVVECLNVSHIGVTYLLSANKKLEDFSYGHDLKKLTPTFGTANDVLSGLDWSVECPSMSRFVFENNRDSRLAVDLQAIVAKFPNLTYLKINCMGRENLRPLTSLKKLTGFEVKTSVKMPLALVRRTWENVKALLRSIGGNITTLKLACWIVGAKQADVNFIFKACPNVEDLKFDFGGGGLVIPPFQKLKQLQPCVFFGGHLDPVLKFEENPCCEEFSLETLSLVGFPVNLPLIKSIMLDEKFANLSAVETILMEVEDLVEIEQTARDNNLDFELKNYRDWEDYHTSTRFYSEDDYFSDFENDRDHDSDSGDRWDTDFPDLHSSDGSYY